jgi:hypothetical protein
MDADTKPQYQVSFTYHRRGKLHHVKKAAPRKCRNMAEAQEWALGVCLGKGYRLDAIRKEPTKPEYAAAHRHLVTVIKNTIDRLIKPRLSSCK